MVGRSQLTVSVRTPGNVHLRVYHIGYYGIGSVGIVHVARILPHRAQDLKSFA